MSQNRSHAVMAQRREARDSLDDFPTPPWGGRALVEHVLYRSDLPWRFPDPASLRVLEPAANRGHLVRALRPYFGTVEAADVHDYGVGYAVRDFTLSGPLPEPDRPDLVITNPPFTLAVDFVRTALGPKMARIGCAVLVRGTWLETKDRYELTSSHPPALVAQFAERLPIIEGYVAARAVTATSYCWVVFIRGQTDTRFRLIPPCRARLERPGDYPPWPDQARLLTAVQLEKLAERHAAGGPLPRLPLAVIEAEMRRRTEGGTA